MNVVGAVRNPDRPTSNGGERPSAELQARLAAIVASSDDGIVSKDLSGVIQSWNASAERIFGYTAAEMIGRSITTLIPPDRIGEESDILAKLRRGERVDHFQTIRMRKDGRLIPVSVTISPLHDGTGRVIGASKIVRDLSETARLEGTFKAIVESSDDAIVSKDLDGVVQSWNPGAERIFGYTAAEMIGRSIAVLFPPDRLDEEPRILEKLRRGERVDHFQTVRRRKDGTLIDVSVTISPVRGPTGEVIGASKIARDVTAFKQLLRQREELLAREQAARQEAERVSRVKDEFLAKLSHELRTPLTPVLLTASLMETNPALPADLREDVAAIRRNVELESQLISDLLDLTRISRGKLQLEKADVDLHPILRAAVDICQREASSPLSLELAADRHVVHGDATRLQQIFWNLVNNAKKFSEPGAPIAIRTSNAAGGRIVVEVIDQGVGIDAAFLPKLFDAFEQADDVTGAKRGGLGLGLAISKQLAEAHGGTIAAASEGPGRGATFTVGLPTAAVPANGKPDVPAPATLPRTAHPRHVLLVEDNEPTLGALTTLLRRMGHRVTPVTSVASAMAAAGRTTFDLIISDLGLPDGSGLDVMRRLRGRYDGRAIALTGYGMESDIAASREAGFAQHLTKPVDLARLDAAIRAVSVNEN